jgi:hypothetical protein
MANGKTMRNGYVVVSVPGHPRASKNNYVYEHILVAEEMFGGFLPAGYRVHHNNGVTDDNRPENLTICKNQSQHMAIHEKHNQPIRSHDACGHDSWRKCKYCQLYDDPDYLYIAPRPFRDVYHKECRNIYQNKMNSEKRGVISKKKLPFTDAFSACLKNKTLGGQSSRTPIGWVAQRNG